MQSGLIAKRAADSLAGSYAGPSYDDILPAELIQGPLEICICNVSALISLMITCAYMRHPAEICVSEYDFVAQ